MAYNKFYQTKAEMNREKEAMDSCLKIESVEAYLKRGGKVEVLPPTKYVEPPRRPFGFNEKVQY